MKKAILLGILVVVLTPSCKKKKENPSCEAVEDGTIKLNLHHMVGPATFEFNTDFTDDYGNNYQFTRADWYLRVPGFLQHDNVTPIVNTNSYFKIDPEVLELTYGAIAPTALHNMQWGVGVDSTTNHLDPNTYVTGSALSNQSPSMHWGWSTGYIFCVLEGLVDIDGNGSYDPLETFALHVGMDGNYRDGANLHVNTEVTDGGTTNIHLDVDYSSFIDSVDLSIENSTHTMDNMPLAMKIANNFNKVLNLH